MEEVIGHSYFNASKMVGYGSETKKYFVKEHMPKQHFKIIKTDGKLTVTRIDDRQ